MTITTTALFAAKSGTSWTHDVTLLNLSEILPLKDFTVIDVVSQTLLDNTFLTKTSQTVLTYNGPDIGTNVALEFRRNTPINSVYYEIPHGGYLSSQQLNEQVERILRKLNEIQDFPGAVLGSYVLEQAYGPAWSTDNITARTANVMYDELELKAYADGDTITNVTINNASADTISLTNAQTTTQPPGTSDLTLASTAYADASANAAASAAVTAALQAAYPVGSVYINTAVDTNPATLLGFGTWVRIGQGRVLVGLDTTQTEFDTLGETGGAKTHTLTESESAPHTHGSESLTGQIILHGNNLYTNIAAVSGIVSAGALNGQYVAAAGTPGANSLGTLNINATHTHDSFGGGQAHNNLQPYLVVCMWSRTA